MKTLRSLTSFALYAVSCAAGLAPIACSSSETDCRDLVSASTPACRPAAGGPTFGGVDTIATDADGRLVVSWKPATDAETSAEKMRYRVHVSRVKGRTLRQPPIESAPGAASAVVRVPQGEELFVLVRAVDEGGIEDGNTIEKSARATPDTVAPAFGGAQSAAPADDRGVKIGWAPASDDRTPTESMRYVVYGGRGTLVDFSKPLLETAADAKEATLTKLGAPGESWSFVVVARDIAGNVNAERRAVVSDLGPTTEAPTFAGCEGVSVVGREATVTWSPAAASFASADAITYQVFSATASGAHDFNGAPAATVKGATSATLSALTPGTTYFLVCRAVDDRGHRDENKNEKQAAISSDVTPPTFAGYANFVFDGNSRTVTLDWAAATDDVTAPTDIVYEVYERKGAEAFDFAKPPRATTPAGATSVIVTDLEPESTLHWVVRARDAAHNRDGNTQEAVGTTALSFSRQVVPLLRRNCAVVGCHSSGFSAGGLSLSPALAYGNTVSVPANQRPPGRPTPINRITPNDENESYLYLKVLGVPGTFVASAMPAPGTGNVLSTAEKDLIKNWILSGALDN